MHEEAALKEAEEAAPAQLDEIASTGVVEVAEFSIDRMPSDAMRELMRACRERWVVAFHPGGSMPGIETLMAHFRQNFTGGGVSRQSATLTVHPGWEPAILRLLLFS